MKNVKHKKKKSKVESKKEEYHIPLTLAEIINLASLIEHYAPNDSVIGDLAPTFRLAQDMILQAKGSQLIGVYDTKTGQRRDFNRS